MNEEVRFYLTLIVVLWFFILPVIIICTRMAQHKMFGDLYKIPGATARLRNKNDRPSDIR